jgi:transcriptional regulator with XRE-family HTH domain
MTIGATVKEIRRRAGLTQDEVAAALGLSQMHLSNIERDARTTDEEEVLAIKRAIVTVLQAKSVRCAEIAESMSA